MSGGRGVVVQGIVEVDVDATGKDEFGMWWLQGGIREEEVEWVWGRMLESWRMGEGEMEIEAVLHRDGADTVWVENEVAVIRMAIALGVVLEMRLNGEYLGGQEGMRVRWDGKVWMDSLKGASFVGPGMRVYSEYKGGKMWVGGIVYEGDRYGDTGKEVVDKERKEL